MCNDFLLWKTLCRHYGRNNESVNAGLSKFQGLAARNVEIGVHMQTQPFNKHGISAELKKKITFYVSGMSKENKLRNQGRSGNL